MTEVSTQELGNDDSSDNSSTPSLTMSPAVTFFLNILLS